MPLSTRTRAAIAAVVSGITLQVLGAGADYSAEVRLQLADLLFGQERYSEAVRAYDLARDEAAGPARRLAALGLVKSLLRTGDFRRARTEVTALVEIAPRDSVALAVQGDVLWASGLFDEAEARYREAATLSPAEARARTGLAKALAARSLLDDALVEARAAVELAPRDAEFHHTLGFVLERLRRFDEAALAMRNYLNLLPHPDQSEKALWTTQQVRFLESFGKRRPLFVDPEHEAEIYSVPFRLVRDKVVVRGAINGRDMDIVMDTGAEMTVVSQRTAERTGIVPIVYTLTAGVGQHGFRGLQVGRMDRLQIGKLRVENVPTLIKNPPLKGLPTQEAESFSPLSLGFSVHIDYRRRLLTIARRLPERNYQVELPLRHHRLALVRGLVNRDNPVHFVVDTGGEVISLSRATAQTLRMQPVRHIPLRVYGTSGWDPDAFLLTGVDLAFDRISMPRLAVVVLNLDAPSVLLGFEVGGIVGHRFLSRYDVAIDLQRSVVGLTGTN